MKKLVVFLKKIVFSFLLLYGLNITLSRMGVLIPINFINILITYFLGPFGILSLIIIKIFII